MSYHKILLILNLAVLVASNACVNNKDEKSQNLTNVRFCRYNNLGKLVYDTVLIDTSRFILHDRKAECIIDTVVNGWEMEQSRPYYITNFKINSKYTRCKAFAKSSFDGEMLSLFECDVLKKNVFKTSFIIGDVSLKKRHWIEYYLISDTSDERSKIFKFSLGMYLNGKIDTSTFYIYKPCESQDN